MIGSSYYLKGKVLLENDVKNLKWKYFGSKSVYDFNKL